MDASEKQAREKLGDELVDGMITIARVLARLGRTPDQIRAGLEHLFPEAAGLTPPGWIYANLHPGD